MNPKLEAALCRDFPGIFRDHGAPMTGTALCWVFECHDGWEPIIRQACEQFKIVKAASGIQVIIASPVKKKYGSLCFYIITDESGCKDEKAAKHWKHIIDAIQQRAEHMSEHTCEVCGEHGEISQTPGWLSCLCEKHRKEEEVRLEKRLEKICE